MVNGNGKFSVSSCYSMILEKNEICKTNDMKWKWLWKLKLPHRVTFFLWLLRQNKILTNMACHKRGITQTYGCKKCGYGEDRNLIFKECLRAKKVWLHLSPNALNNPEVDFDAWLDGNLKNKNY